MGNDPRSGACLNHLDFIGTDCPDCGLHVDQYGNTEAQFSYCCFPDCGCDGARLCMAANGPSDNAYSDNVEGMYTGNSLAQRRARVGLIKYALTGKAGGE